MTTILVLTGSIGSGKTTAASWVVSLARMQGLRCDGLLAPPRLAPDGQKVGIDGIRVGTGETRRLADKNLSEPGDRFGGWRFLPGALDWALEAVMDAADSRPDLLVVDEIGPMELMEGRGLAPVLPALGAGALPLALVLVRETLLPMLEEQLAGCDVRVYRVETGSRAELPQKIAGEWFAGRTA